MKFCVGAMKMNRTLTAAAALLLVTSLAPDLSAAPKKAKKSTTAHSLTAAHSTRSAGKSSRKTVKGRPAKKLRVPQAIEPARVSLIQDAVLKAHYLTGEPSGVWDSSTVAAMQKYQADNSWQTKLMPDSRALIKLGLGPDYSGAINAKGSNFVSLASAPQPAALNPQTAGFAEASGARQ
jgi:hypothetical protein